MNLAEPGLAAIGTIDSSGGAGLNQDIRTARLMGFQLETCVAALSLQDDQGLKAIYPVDLVVFQAGLEQILENTNLQYLKIGALGNTVQMQLLLDGLSRKHHFKVILDPVVKASRGLSFVDKDGLALLQVLAAKADFVCPNLPELEVLTEARISCFEDAIAAAQAFTRQFGTTLLVKGGHGKGKMLQEALVNSDCVTRFSFPAQNWSYTHGTGCALATAFMCFLTKGNSPETAFKSASAWVRDFYQSLNSR
jgi:hydroxymethylpyrimidine/phosphomethylpyrimidine kinase